MKLVQKFAAFYFLCASLALSIASFASNLDQIAWQNDPTTKQAVLSSRPSGSACAGVLPVFTDPATKKSYILLSREAFNGSKDKPKGTYCDCGGSVDFDHKRGVYQTFGHSALREFYEESGRLYDFKNNFDLLVKNARVVYNTRKMMAYFNVPYKPRQEFLAQRKTLINQGASHHYYEKDDFLWVDAQSLYNSIKNLKGTKAHTDVAIKTLNDDKTHSDKNIKLRRGFLKTLIHSKEILKKYTQ